jgi:hypothetical protein
MEDSHREQAPAKSGIRSLSTEAPYERPEVFELGNVEELTFGHGGTLADGKTIAHNPQPTPADFPDD